MEERIKSFKDLFVWQKAMDLVVLIYKITDEFSRSEIYGLTSQMRRCVVSIPSNIAEGKMRGTQKDFRHFLITAYASGAELETQIEIAKRLGFVDTTKIIEAENLLIEIMKMLNVFIQKISVSNN